MGQRILEPLVVFPAFPDTDRDYVIFSTGDAGFRKRGEEQWNVYQRLDDKGWEVTDVMDSDLLDDCFSEEMVTAFKQLRVAILKHNMYPVPKDRFISVIKNIDPFRPITVVTWNCYKGEGRVCSVPVSLEPCDPETNRAWQWDGNEENPTLEPSIRCMEEGCGFHGYIKGGFIEHCDDSPYKEVE